MQVSVQTSPDPFLPVIGCSLSADRLPDARSFGPLQRRRANILAATRRSLAVEGHNRFTLRSISDASGVSTQTIHNCFGCKSELLRSALNQHTALIDSFAFSRTRNPALFIMLALAYCQSAVDHPAFMREFMHTDWSVRSSLMKFGADLKAKILHGMSARNLLRPTASPKVAAEQIAYVNSFGLLEWADNDDIVQLYERLVHGNANILMGILQPEAAREIERWLANPDNLGLDMRRLQKTRAGESANRAAHHFDGMLTGIG